MQTVFRQTQDIIQACERNSKRQTGQNVQRWNKTNKKRFVKKFGHGRVNRDFGGIRTKPIFSHKRIPKKNSRLTVSECCLWLTFYCSIWDDQKTAINIAVRASVILFLCFYVKVCVCVCVCVHVRVWLGACVHVMVSLSAHGCADVWGWMRIFLQTLAWASF